jgi:hypothetical protein
VIACSLPRKQNTKKNECCDNQRGVDAAEIESARRKGFGEKVTHRRAQRTGEDERRPEQQRTRDLRLKIGDREKH